MRDAVTVAGGQAAYRALTHRRLLILAAFVVVLLASLATDLMIGPARLGFAEVATAVLAPARVSPAVRTIVWELRMPVVLMALVTGAALAIAGAQMQTILANPLASPFTLGISAAASFGAAFALVTGLSILPLAPEYIVPLDAFLVAMVAALLIYGLSRSRGASTETVILLGIAVVFTFTSLTSLLQFFASDQALSAVVFWTIGSLGRATWFKLALTSAALAVALPFFLRRVWAMTTLRLGDEKAASYGVNVARLRLEVMLLVSLIAAVPVAFVGPIGFVGLVGPHIARMIIGEDQRFFLPASALVGAFILSAASVASKVVIPGVVVPVGIVTALVGMPLFFGLILSSRKRAW